MVDEIWQTAVTKRFADIPTSEDREKHFGDALINKWKIEFERRCWDSDQFAESSFHVLFGQMNSIRALRIQYEHNVSDNRVHMILFQRSGTGKGRGFNFTVEMANRLNLTCISPDDTTDAKLVGRYRQVEGEEEPVLSRGYLDPQRVPRVSIMIQNEATLVIDAKKTDFSKKFMNFYQKAMNPIGTPDNLIEAGTMEMGDQEVRINPDLSFYLTTYPPDKLLETITKAGFIQRMITLYNVIGYNKRVESWEKMGKKTGKVSEGEDYTEEIVDAMKIINNYYKTNPYITMSPQASALCPEVIRQIYIPLNKVNDAMREHLGDFVPRLYENAIKLSYHHAMTRLSNVVENTDIGYSLSVMLPSWARLITYMEESDEIVAQTLKRWDRFRNDAFREYDRVITEQRKRKIENDGWIKRETLVKLLSTKVYGWGVSKQTVRSRLSKLTNDFGYFAEKNEKGIRFIRKIIT